MKKEYPEEIKKYLNTLQYERKLSPNTIKSYEENLEILSNELEKVRHQLLDNCNS